MKQSRPSTRRGTTKTKRCLNRERSSGSVQRVVLRLAESWERKARELQRAAKDSGNELLAASADTRLQDVWELRAEVEKTQNAEIRRTEPET